MDYRYTVAIAIVHSNYANMSKNVAILAYDHLASFEFSCALEIFALERSELGVEWYQAQVTSIEDKPLRTLAGVSINAPFQPEIIERADIIVVPGWPFDRAPQDLVERLQSAHRRGALICSICSGAFLLAQAGLLDHKSATTHWRYAEKMKEAFPTIRVDPSVLYVEHENIITSAGSAAGLDMLLHIVRNDYGQAIANKVAQRLVIPTQREGGQAQYIPSPMLPINNNRLNDLLSYLKITLNEQHCLRSMASFSALSTRSLQRYFQESLGTTPMAWLVQTRIAHARELLEQSDLGLLQIMELCGFQSEENFRHHFKKHVKTSPARYRAQFKSKN